MSAQARELWLRLILQDCLYSILLGVAAFGLGAAINHTRDKPLAWRYEDKKARLQHDVQRILHANVQTVSVQSGAGDLSLEEFQKVLLTGNAIILDARPEIFHRFGHVPGALSLPREDFENAYRRLESRLTKDKLSPIIIYCSDVSCEDSSLVQSALHALGFVDVRIFAGGWNEWQAAGLSAEN